MNFLDFNVEVLLLLQQFPQLVLVLKLVRNESVEFLSGVVFYELDYQ